MNPTIKIHDAQSDKVIEREMTDKELAQFELDKIEMQAQKDNLAVKVAEKAALLERLGLSEAEAALLIS